MTALEQQMTEVRALAAGAHEDAGTALSVQRQQARVINGWGEQLNARLDEIDTRLTTRLDGLDTKLTTRLDALDTRLTMRLDSVETEMRHGFTEIKDLINRALGNGNERGE